MYMFPPHGERERNNIFTAWSQCVSTRNKHLYNIYRYSEFFFLSSFCPGVSREGLYWKAFIATTKIFYTQFPVRVRSKRRRFLLVWSREWEKRHEGRTLPSAQSVSAYDQKDFPTNQNQNWRGARAWRWHISQRSFACGEWVQNQIYKFIVGNIRNTQEMKWLMLMFVLTGILLKKESFKETWSLKKSCFLKTHGPMMWNTDCRSLVKYL